MAKSDRLLEVVTRFPWTVEWCGLSPCRRYALVFREMPVSELRTAVTYYLVDLTSGKRRVLLRDESARRGGQMSYVHWVGGPERGPKTLTQHWREGCLERLERRLRVSCQLAVGEYSHLQVQHDDPDDHDPAIRLPESVAVDLVLALVVVLDLLRLRLQ